MGSFLIFLGKIDKFRFVLLKTPVVYVYNIINRI